MAGSKSRSIRAFAILILAGVILVGLLVLSGLLDPRPQGAPVWQQARSELDLAELSEEIRFLTAYPIDSDIVLNLASRAASGELDIGYGLALSSDEDTIVIAVSPLGYAAIWEAGTAASPSGRNYLMPWQTWPHILSGRQENEIQLWTSGNILAVRVNHELLWQGAIPGQYDRVNLYGISYGDEAVIEARSIELFVEH
jgi:hypothetical protein